MRKNKFISTILIIALLFIISGCKKSESITSPSSTSVITVTPTISPTIEPTPILTLEELSMKAYEKFMKNESKVSFDRFMPKNKKNMDDKDLFKKGSEYALSEVLSIVTANYFQNFTNKKIGYIDYSYIDCGKDGVNELVLCLNGMDLYSKDDSSTLVYIIKYIDGKLSLCYYYETWARSHSTLNEYGYCESGGSSGASNSGENYGLINKDGIWRPIVSIEHEQNINQLTYKRDLGKIPEVAKKKGIPDGIEIDTIKFDYGENAANSGEAGNKECFYTFYVYGNNREPIKDPNLYTNSKYKEIFDEAKIPFITPDELSAMISEKEEKVGATAEIKKGKDITWKTLSGNMFSDYVGR